MKRIVGRRLIDDEPKTALAVTVYRRWWWQRDEFYSDQGMSVNINPNHDILTVDMKTEVYSYNPRDWRKVVSREVPARSRV